MPDPARWPPRLVAVAPGPGTAEALAAVGIAGARIPATTFDSEGMLALPELSVVRGKRIVIFRGDGGREELGETLSRARSARRLRRVLSPGTARERRGGTARSVPRGARRCGHDHLERGSRQSLGIGRRRDARGVAPLSTFVPHQRIADHARGMGLSVVETAGGDAGLIAGLLEWAAAQLQAKN